ncbi:MAG: cyclic nucleotide-binding domain-containing protein, partial [Planctomycetaceae bacterium]|nr:cyclic nucleotide-binding domain-containing protein [Planctomycetaceae bacterium]
MQDPNDPQDHTVSFSKVQRLLDVLDEKFASQEPFSLEEVARENSLSLGNSAVFEELIAHHFRRLQENCPEMDPESYLSHFESQNSWYDVAESACYSSSIFRDVHRPPTIVASDAISSNVGETHGIPEFTGGPLAALSVEMQRKLRSQMTEATFADREKLLSEGDVGDCLYVIATGTVMITSKNPQRDSEILAVISSGQVIGEMALMGVSYRTADATAHGEVRALKLLAKDFQQICRKHLEIAQVVTEIIGTRLGNQQQDALFSKSLNGYEIHRRLGRGGMSVVYDATHLNTGFRVALKMMSHRLAFDDYARAYFQQEADAVASFDHPNIPRYHELFDAFATSFMAIEFIEGLGLDSLIRRGGAIEEEQVLRIGSHVANALHYAHSAGIVHRDVKPA